MKRIRNTIKDARTPVGAMTPNSRADTMEIPEFLRCSRDSSLYIEEIHYRAETVTPVLEGIPGYPGRNG